MSDLPRRYAVVTEKQLKCEEVCWLRYLSNDLKLAQLGYNTLIEMLYDIPHVVRIEKAGNDFNVRLAGSASQRASFEHSPRVDSPLSVWIVPFYFDIFIL